VICEPQLDWISKSAEELAAARRRQGVRFVTAHSVIVANSEPVKQSKFSVSGKKVSFRSVPSFSANRVSCWLSVLPNRMT